MKLLAILASAAVLAGCASRDYGSWLDTLGAPARPPVAIGDERAAELLDQVRTLQVREYTLRAQLAQEKDRVARVRGYRELERLGNERAPLEQQLRDAGRPPRALLGAPAA